MESYIGYIYWFLLLVLLVLGIIQTRTARRFLKALEEHEYETWKELGSPTLMNNSPQITIGVLKSVFRGRFENSVNPAVVELASKVKTDLKIYFSVFAMLLLVFALSMAST